MTLTLPAPITRYFAADATEGADLAQCFTPNAVVKDEGHTYTGLSAIRAWKAGTVNQYTYTSEPFACEVIDARILVTSHLVGDFPGSPLDLRFFFGLEGDKIASLEILV
ncbi:MULTISPECIES: nuclear transport factor 2 family protein [unclassified Pseudomonas]|uniref:nuclear transport factor 2 family protein n=1 Tax=unclassified Pseudomonas TaxID=196821 RepID=UPI0032643B16